MSLAKKHQCCGSPQPLSMATMYTPSDIRPTAQDLLFRRRAVELSQQYNSDESCEEAIVGMVNILAYEGLHCNYRDVNKDFANLVEDQMTNVERGEEKKQLLLIYHYLIWKTAATKSWTIPRNPGQCSTIPYLPSLLQANLGKIVAETAMGQRTSDVADLELSSDVMSVIKCDISNQMNTETETIDDGSKPMFIPQDWKEVNILEFINASLPEDESLLGPRSQPVCHVITSKERTLTWKEAQDSDVVNGDELFANEGEDGAEEDNPKLYVRSKNDIRALYEMRPLRQMTLGQFASEYRRLKPSGHGYQKAKDMIDSKTGLGPETTQKVAGFENIMAPQCMRLKNEDIMVRRSGQKAVLQLKHSGKLKKFGNQLLWTHWKYLEDVKEDKNEDDEELKRKRLEIFPKSVYNDLSDEDID